MSFFSILSTNAKAEPIELAISNIPPALQNDFEFALDKWELYINANKKFARTYLDEIKDWKDSLWSRQERLDIYLYPWVLARTGQENMLEYQAYCKFEDIKDYENIKFNDYVSVTPKLQKDYIENVIAWRAYRDAACSLSTKYGATYKLNEKQKEMINKCGENFTIHNNIVMCYSMETLYKTNKK